MCGHPLCSYNSILPDMTYLVLGRPIIYSVRAGAGGGVLKKSIIRFILALQVF